MQFKDHNVHIVDDDPGVSHALKLMLETQGCVVSTYPDGIRFLETDLRKLNGCILLDVRMPQKDGLTVLSEALEVNPALQIVMISGHGDIPMAVKALEKGAVDFIEKPFKAAEIMRAMQKACGRLEANTKQQDFVLKAMTSLATLTPRELEITQRLAEGKANKIVAFELGISIRTVETHRARIMSKLRANSVAELVKIYLAAG